MSVSVTIKDFLIDKIGKLSSVEAVYGYETLNFSGIPTVVITPANMTGEFTSTSENSRIYGYNIQIFFPLGQDVETPKTKPREQYADDVICTVIDDIIDGLDTDFNLAALTAPTTRFGEAADVQWGYVDIEGGKYRWAQVVANIYTEKTVT